MIVVSVPAKIHLLGEHTDEVLSKILGYSEEQIKKIKEDQKENTEERLTHTQKRR